MSNEANWYPEFESLAEHLSGRPVVLRWRDPPGMNDGGLTTRHRLRFYIDIQPGLDTLFMFSTFLHECAHVWMGNIYSTDTYLNPSRSEKGTSDEPGYDDSGTEKAADKIAAYWLAWAEAHSFRILDPGDSAHVRIKVYAQLLKSCEGGLQ